MDSQFISFAAVVPPSGFRWIYRDPAGAWQLIDPPEDWPQVDYEAAQHSRRQRQSELSDRFLIAASWDECFLAGGGEQDPPPPKTLNVPDLYLSFASELATPGAIQSYASRFGLLRFDKSKISIRRELAADLEPGFTWINGSRSDFLHFQAERASDWLREFEAAHYRLKVWSGIKARRDPEEMRLFLEDPECYYLGGQATFRLKSDGGTRTIGSEVIASSLADMLRIQFAASIAANVLHRPCRECRSWFAVHPSSGRPEKEFCSNACRMRAYRRRHPKVGRTSKK